MEVYVILFFNAKGNKEEFYQTGQVWRSLEDAINHVYSYAENGRYFINTEPRSYNDGIVEIYLRRDNPRKIYSEPAMTAYIIRQELL